LNFILLMELNNLDILSIKPSLYIKSQTRYKSHYGAFLTVLCSLAILTLALFFMINFINKTDLNVIWYKESANFSPFIDLNQKILMFRFRDINLNKIDPRIASIQATYWSFHSTGNYTTYYLDLEPCSTDKHFPDYPELINFNASTFQCIKQSENNNFTLWSNPASKTRAFFNIYLVSCKNTTDRDTCYSQDIIDSKLKSTNMFFDYYMSMHAIDHYDPEAPLKDAIHSTTYKITYDFFFTYYEYYKNIVYTSDDGKVFENKKTYNGFEYDEINTYNVISLRESTKTIIDGSFTIFQIMINDRYSDSYRRTYPKLQSIIANIAGVLEVIWFVGRLTIELITPAMMYLDIAHDFADLTPNHRPRPTEKSSSDLGAITTYNLTKLQSLPNENIRPRRVQKAVKKNLSLIDSIIPKFVNKSSNRQLADRCKELVTKLMSIEYIINNMNQFKRLKQILLNKDPLKLFDNLPFFKLEEQFPEKKNARTLEIHKTIQSGTLSNDPITKKLISVYND
jgi:hypothetical protein